MSLTPEQYQRIGREAVAAVRDLSASLDAMLSMVLSSLTKEQRVEYDRLVHECGYLPLDALDYLGVK